MKKLILLSVAAMGLIATPAMAGEGDTGAYGNIGVALYDVDSSVFGIVGRIGYKATDYFGVEGEGSIGVNSDNGFKVKSSFAGFGVLSVPAGENFDVFARVGYHSTNFGLNNASGSLDGVAWGLGANFMFTENDGVRVDYTRYEVSAGGISASSDTISAAYVRKF